MKYQARERRSAALLRAEIKFIEDDSLWAESMTSTDREQKGFT